MNTIPMRSYFLLPIALIFFQSLGFSQIVTPVKWTYHAETIDAETAELIFEAKIDDGWAIYSQYLESDDGPIRTSFNFEDGAHFAKEGKTEETGNRKEAYDKLFEMNLIKFTKVAKFTQRVKIADFSKPIKGYLEFMTCDETRCLPPDDMDFEFIFEAPKTGSVEPAEKETPKVVPAPKEQVAGELEKLKDAKTNAKKANRPKQGTKVTKSNPGLGAAQLDQNNTGGGGGKLQADSKKKRAKYQDEEETLGTHNTRDPKYSVDGQGQIFDPVDWSASYVDKGNGTFDLILKAKIDKGWHIYSRYLGEGDAIPFTYEFTEADHFEVVGNGKEESPKIVKEYDEGFEMDLVKLKEAATETQTIKTTDPSKPILGFFEFAVCDHIGCLPPELVPIKILPAEQKVWIGEEAEETGATGAVTAVAGIGPYPSEVGNIDLDNPSGACEGVQTVDKGDGSIWSIFILGLLGGLVALLTPCVFPMIPLTVSFFTKSSESRANGLKKAILYGFFIFLVYFLLSIPFHLMDSLNPDILNEISTNVVLNLIFFAVFMFFAFSFFGYYELTLPAKWTNRASSAEGVGGMLGVFFMALTLALVSFSCTGPILGSLLAGSLSSDGGAMQLTAGMSGFGVALGLPFALFAAFPRVMDSLPQSGGWLNTVKVVLGFVELALALKFLSNADLVKHWGILKIEPFLILWILIAIGLALYLFGFIKFPHDSPLKKVGIARGGIGVLSLAFAAYLCTGFMYNEQSQSFTSLKLLSGFPPPVGYSWVYPKECPNNLDCFKDLESGWAYAKENNKPILIDFTGHACVNCRKMEENVWPQPQVLKYLKDDYVLISLYVDEKIDLPVEEQIDVIRPNGQKRKLKWTGHKWQHFETKFFKQNAQPYYALLSPDGELLNDPVPYTPDADEYATFLECGLTNFANLRKTGMK